MSSKPVSKTSKKRKVGPVGEDLSQRRLDRFFSPSSTPANSSNQAANVGTATLTNSSSSSPPASIVKNEDDPMDLDSHRSPSTTTTITKAPFLGTLKDHQQTLLPTISIVNCSPARRTELSTKDVDDNWNILKILVVNVFTSDPQISNSRFDFCTASRLAEGLCRYGKAEQLFQNLRKETELHVKRLKEMLTKTLQEREQQAQSQHKDTTLLQNLYSSWTTYCQHLSMLRNVFMELDRTYILSSTKYTSIIQLGKQIYSEIILNMTELRAAIITDIIQLITWERNRTSFEQQQEQSPNEEQKAELRKLIRAIILMFIELDYYSSDFEPCFIKSTVSYYRGEANRLIHQQGVNISDYLQHCQRRYEEETKDRLTSYLDSHTKQALQNAVKDELVCSNIHFILDNGFEAMMKETQLSPLKTLYDLVAEQSTKLQLLRQAFGSYIKKHGSMILSNVATPDGGNMIVSLIKFLKRVNRVLHKSFMNDATFLNVTKESFEAFINQRGSKPAELLARFVDSRLKMSASKKMKESETNQTNVLDLSLSLFRYIQAKDMFEQFYKRALSKRLLLDRSTSHEMEKYVVEKLKLECGYEFTKDMEKMFQDIQVSVDLQREFNEQEKAKVAKKQQQQQRLNMIVKVVNTSVWPTYPNSPITLPIHMAEMQRSYEKFYNKKFKERKLTWQNSLSSCSLYANFPKGTKEILCNLSQAVILMIFNDTKKQSFTFSEIQAICGLEKKELLSLLKSISSNDYEFIKFEPLRPQGGKSNTITSNDKFKFNVNFESTSVRMRLPAPTIDPTADKAKDVEQKVHVNRQHQVEAAIVRLMKKNKQMTHNQLMDQLLEEQIFRSIEASDIKKRIESLIDRDYMIRDVNDSSLYIYQS